MQGSLDWNGPGGTQPWAALDAGEALPGWQALLDAFRVSAQGERLQAFLQERLAQGAVIYPPQPLRALSLTALDAVRVVILGQDPYHGPGQAEGLAFSAAPGVPAPPSLRNIFKELQRDLGVPAPANGSLVRWATQGVLLLNSCLSVENGRPASHAGQGWEALSDAIVRACSDMGEPKAFLLWGAHAQKSAALIDARRHLLLSANHPSPLSATRAPVPFIGCGHFGQVSRWLATRGEAPIRW